MEQEKMEGKLKFLLRNGRTIITSDTKSLHPQDSYEWYVYENSILDYFREFLKEIKNK
jgi:hypothetical protein